MDEKGKDAGNNDLDGSPVFCVGCVANPQAVPLEPQLMKLQKKIMAGAEFILTLDIFDLDKAIPFFDHMKGKEVKILAGVRLITETDLRLSEQGKLPGNPLPDSIKEEVKALQGTDEIVENSRTRMIEMIKRLKETGLCHGVHVTMDGHEDLLPQIIQEAGI